MDTTTIDRPMVGFLEDWKGDDHRELAQADRERVAHYIRAIVMHDQLVGGLSEEGRLGAAAMLWVAFRDGYDSLRGPFMKSAAEDVRRAMARI